MQFRNTTEYIALCIINLIGILYIVVYLTEQNMNQIFNIKSFVHVVSIYLPLFIGKIGLFVFELYHQLHKKKQHFNQLTEEMPCFLLDVFIKTTHAPSPTICVLVHFGQW